MVYDASASVLVFGLPSKIHPHAIHQRVVVVAMLHRDLALWREAEKELLELASLSMLEGNLWGTGLLFPLAMITSKDTDDGGQHP